MTETDHAGLLRKLKLAQELPKHERDRAEQDLAFEFYNQNWELLRRMYRKKTGQSLDEDVDLLTAEQSMKPYRRIRSWFKRCLAVDTVGQFKWNYVVSDFIRDIAANTGREFQTEGAGISDSRTDEAREDPEELDTWILDIVDESVDTLRMFREPRRGVYLRRQLILRTSKPSVERSQAPRQSSPDVYRRRQILLGSPP